MKKIHIIIAILALFLLNTSCENDGGTSVIPLENGATPNFKLVTGSDDFIDLTGFDALSLKFTVDIGIGSPTSMDLKAFWTTINGDLYGPVTLDANITTFPKEYSITGADILNAFTELNSNADLNVGDKLILFTSVTLANGKTLELLNDKAEPNYYAADFNQYAGLNIIQTYAVSCPSNLGGTYSVVSNGDNTDGQPPAVNLPYTVTVMDNGGGNYTISDGVAGVYIFWYSVYGYTFETTGNFTDVCGNLSGTWGTSFGGDSITLTGTANEDGTLSIHWENAFGDFIDAVYTPQ
ncbi:hypothetical protein [Confluentibacter sediminis]|uniref:hypothetical protein n=1 Tax=Confluentibacter sediminis TaxID=2219045 RepID=UPI000DAD9F81|nr:hypothetical protein [Confluentibacter sediminis]